MVEFETAGNLGDVGIKGELQFFKSRQGNKSTCLLAL
jgi:hypothetical protein